MADGMCAGDPAAVWKHTGELAGKAVTTMGKRDFRAVGREGMWDGAGRAQEDASGLEVSICVLGT